MDANEIDGAGLGWLVMQERLWPSSHSPKTVNQKLGTRKAETVESRVVIVISYI